MFKIKTATHADVAHIGLLFKETILNINIRDYTAEQVKLWASGYNEAGKWERKISEQYFILAIEDDVVCGMASVTPSGYIDYMYVSKDHQGKGVATLLFNNLIEKATEWNVTKLTSDVSLTAKPFFLYKDFHVVREQNVLIKGTYFTNFHMEKVLK